MNFDKKQIAEFKRKGRSYITWRKSLKRSQIQDFFYNSDERYSIKALFPDKDLEYCKCSMYDIVIGDYQLGLKYVNENGTYYMFISANSFWAPPQAVAIGKAIDGKIYLIKESFPDHRYRLSFIEILEEYINKNERGYRPRSYNHSILIASDVEKVAKDITDEDVKCIKIAYEGIRAFSKLIDEID